VSAGGDAKSISIAQSIAHGKFLSFAFAIVNTFPDRSTILGEDHPK
jgi:hypothetical protein